MRYTADSNGYLTGVYLGCDVYGSTEYSGNIPAGYATIEDWLSSERIQAWKIVNGNLQYDSAKEETLPEKDAYALPAYLRDAIYPIGSIYMSANSTSPETLFGGSWEQIEDTFLLACGTHQAGSTGGSESQTISVGGHFHWQTVATNGSLIGSNSNAYGHSKSEYLYNLTSASGGVGSGNGVIGGTSDAGEFSQTISTLPPYLTVYMWKRTA